MFALFTLLFGAMAVLFLVLVFFGVYLFTVYVLSRLGGKFRVGSYFQFLIPIYNVMLLCDCAGLTRWLTIGVIFPGCVASVMNMLSLHVFASSVKTVGLLIGLASNVLLWGTIAKKLGKNFWLWGIITPVLCGFPVLILAFDSSMPKSGGPAQGVSCGDNHNNQGETRYIDVQ